MAIFASIVWFAFVVFCTFFGSIKINDREVRSLSGRFFVSIVAFPLIGFIFWILGFVGDFALSPIFALLS